MKTLSFDTETTGLWIKEAEAMHPDQPNLVQLGAILDNNGQTEAILDVIIRPKGWTIPEKAASIHGVSQERAETAGISLTNALYVLRDMMALADRVVAHNLSYDKNVINRAFKMAEVPEIPWDKVNAFCTKELSTRILKLPSASGRGYKWPTLEEAFKYFYQGEEMVNAHSALADAKYALRVFHGLRRIGVVS